MILKPSPDDIQQLYLNSLARLGLDPAGHDIRFVQDDWESPTLGAWGLGWEVRLDGMEITQFTYFQEVGGIELDPIPVEITYGLERIAMYLQGVDSVFDLVWTEGITYGQIYQEAEAQYSRYNFEEADVPGLFEMFKHWESEAARLLELGLVNPGYDGIIKCSHLFNLLDARGAISVSERVGYIARVRRLARKAATAFVQQREALGFPLLRDAAERSRWIKPAADDESRETAGAQPAAQPVASAGAKRGSGAS